MSWPEAVAWLKLIWWQAFLFGGFCAVVLHVARALWWHWPRRPPRYRGTYGRDVSKIDVPALIARLDCESMREALAEREPEFALECIEAYYEASEEDQAGMREFFESGGPRTIHQLKMQLQDGTPTVADLERWMEER